MTSIKDFPFGYWFRNFWPKYININKGNAVPNIIITAPIPPQVAAEEGPNNAQAPRADATKLVVREKFNSSICN